MNSLLEKIFKTVLNINDQGKYQVFLNLSPHVDNIYLQVYKGEYQEEQEPTIISSSYGRVDMGNMPIREMLKQLELLELLGQE